MVSGVFCRWYLSSATISRLLSWLALTVTLLVAWSAAVAHERKGFVVLPNSVPGLAGPAGGETNIAEILATHEQTGVRSAYGGIQRTYLVDRPCTSIARRMSFFMS